MTDRPRYPRTSCSVPFCRRTSTLFPWEWLCGDHWKLVDRRLKLLRTRLLHGRRKLPLRRWRALEVMIWRKMKRQAIERAGGH